MSQLYPPEPATMRHQMAKDLLARKHDVRAITAFPNYPFGRIYAGYRQSLWARDTVDGADIVRVPIYPNHGHSAIGRACCYLSFALSASILGPFFGGKPDVIWAYQPPLTVGIPALWISLLRRVPLVYEVQDLWPETLASTGMMRSNLGFRMLSAFAMLVYRRSSAIVVPSPGMKKNIVAKGVPDCKVHVIPNWADEEIYKPVPPDPQLAAEHGLSGKFNVVFAGNLGAAQGLETILGAAEQLSDHPDIQFVLIGDGSEKTRVMTQVVERGLTNVVLVGQQPAARMPAFFALADVLLVHLRRDPLFEIMVPAKTQSYLACGKPILMGVAGDAAALIDETGAGLTCQQEDPQDMAASIARFRDMPAEERLRMGTRGRRAFEEQFCRSILVERYEELFSRIGDIGDRMANELSD